MSERILVTGAAGFIGFHLVKRLIKEGFSVIGLDNLNEYYDINLKYARLAETSIDRNKITLNEAVTSSQFSNYSFIKADITDNQTLDRIFGKNNFSIVINLAAQAGVRYSLKNPSEYIQSNIVGFANILESCKKHNVGHLLYASSSSVYGLNEKLPFSTSDNVDHPISLYAATKKSNELMAHSYSHLYGLATTGLRFFTVYGPWGRPDMAPFIFTKSIIEGKPIQVNNNGDMKRDFTYIDDAVEVIIKLIASPPKSNEKCLGKNPDPSSSLAPYKIYNIGGSAPIHLLDFIKAIESELGVDASKEFRAMQAGDVPSTWADIDDLITTTNYKPSTQLEMGIKELIRWYREFYK